MDFVVEYFLRQRSPVIWLHHAMSLTTLAAAIAIAVRRGDGVGLTIASFTLSAAVLFVVVLPLHELAHAAGYFLIGARDIKWGFSARMLAVWVTAPRFVARREPFIFVALAPFIAINVPLLIGVFLYPQWSVFFLFVLLWHLHGASGDFAILNFIWLHRARGFWTWDDGEEGISYFYGRTQPPPN